MARLLGFIGALDQVPFDFERGSGRRLFAAGGHRFETVICYESAFAPLVRDSVHDGAEFVVVSTNNRSYRRSGLSAQHVAMSQMRAAETGRPILHASISGITPWSTPGARPAAQPALREPGDRPGRSRRARGRRPT